MIQKGHSIPVERLTALWAFSEAGLGWFLHAMKIPFAGTIISAAAVMIICMIAYYSDKKFLPIFKALTIVLIIKAAVSPYSPLTAYFAVCFQAVAGAVLFGAISHFRVAALLLGILSLLECAFQRIVFLTILYGNSLWESINVFFGFLAPRLGIAAAGTGFKASSWLIVLYLAAYGVAGVFAGFLGGKLPEAVEEAMKSAPIYTPLRADLEDSPGGSVKTRKSRLKGKFLRLGVWVSCIALTLTFFAPAINGSSQGIYVIVRTAMVLTGWYFVAAPLLMMGLRRMLKHQETGYGNEIRNVLALLPHLKIYAKENWARMTGRNTLVRGWHFLIAMIVFALNFRELVGRQTMPPPDGLQKPGQIDATVA